MKKYLFLFLLAPALLGGYNTSLEIRKDLPGLDILISEDGLKWNYLEEGEGFEKDYLYSSLEIPEKNKTCYFSLGRKTPFKHARSLFRALRPLSAPLAAPLKSRASNFLDLSLGKATAGRSVNLDGLEVKKLAFSLLPDADEDGLPDDKEYALYGAWPGLWDTDGDGLHDGIEAFGGLSPFLADSDGDGLTDANDPHPLVPEFELSYEAWSSHWARVVNQRPSLNAPGILSESNYVAGRTPLQGAGAGEAVFSPAFVTVGGIRELTNAFSLTFFSEGSVTGLVLFSEEAELVPDSVQLIPEDMLPAVPEGRGALPFLARHGMPLNFTLILKEVPEENEEIRLVTSVGLRSEKLIVAALGAQPAKPTLLLPENKSQVSQSVSFRWEYPGNNVTNYILSVSGEEYREFSLSGSSFELALSSSGNYAWSVTAQGQGFESESETRIFFYSSPQGEADGDGDGYSDNEEKRLGSDPQDSRDVPLQAVSNALLRASKDLFFSHRLQARGGLRPLSFRALSVLPRGLKLSREGLLTGLPLRKGKFPLRVEISDQTEKSLVTETEIVIENGRSDILKLGGNDR